MNQHNDYPTWAYPTQRAWKQTKRQALKKLLHALDDVRLGCAFYPDGGQADLCEITARARSLQDKLSVRKWDR